MKKQRALLQTNPTRATINSRRKQLRVQQDGAHHRSFLRRLVVICAIFIALFLTVPNVHAGASTSISDLQYPTTVVLGASKYAEGVPVAFTVAWTEAESGDALIVGIFDWGKQDWPLVEGSKDGPPACIAAPKEAACALPDLPRSGSERFKLLVTPYAVAHSALAVFAQLEDRYGNYRSFDWTPITIRQVTTALVKISAPTGVPVTVDGTTEESIAGTVWENLRPGTHTISVPDIVAMDNSTRLRFDHWSDDATGASRLVTLEDDTQLEALYVRQYLLTVAGPYGNAAGGGWYDQGSTATFSVVAIQPMSGLFGLLGGKYVFSNWAGDSTSTALTAAVLMNGPKTVTAQWRADNTLPYVILGAIIAFMTIALLLTIRRSSAQRPAPPTSTPPAPSAGTALQTIPDTLVPAKFCRRCGAKIPRDTEYCEECGTRLGSRSRE